MYKLYYIQNNKKLSKVYIDYSLAKSQFEDFQFQHIPSELITVRYLSPSDVAQLLGKSKRRIIAEVHQNHFPNWEYCQCGHRNIIIPITDVIPLLEAKRRQTNE